MDSIKAQEVLDKIVLQIFGYKNQLSLEEFKEKFAFDVRLPQQVETLGDGEITWAASTNPTAFMKFQKLRNFKKDTDGLLPKQNIQSIDDLVKHWSLVNFRATERYIDSIDVAQSDGVVECTNVYRSLDIGKSNNILFSDGMSNCEFLAASQRCGESSFCIRLEDSIQCSDSFSISCCTKVVRSFMLHSCYDVQDSMFCTGLKGKRYCIANMQYTKEEYESIKQLILEWILPKTS